MDTNEPGKQDTREPDDANAAIDINIEAANTAESNVLNAQEIRTDAECSSNEVEKNVLDPEAHPDNSNDDKIEENFEDEKNLMPDATESTKENVDDEPMDIDEILESLNTDEITSSDEFGDEQFEQNNDENNQITENEESIGEKNGKLYTVLNLIFTK